MSGTSILLADDDRLVLATLAKGLRDAGYLVTEAANGLEAVEKGCEINPDLAILDIRMPKMTGIEAARELRERADVFALFLTAFDDREFVEQAVSEGALGYLVKPVDVRQIIPTIETSLERANELRQLRTSKEKLTDSLEKNQSISTAIGIYMERYRVGEMEAFGALRAYARSERCKLVDVAWDLVRTTDRRNELAARIHRLHSSQSGSRGAVRKRSPTRAE